MTRSYKLADGCTVEPLFWGHHFYTRKVAFQEEWPHVRGRNKYIYVEIYIFPFQGSGSLVVASKKKFYCIKNKYYL